MRLLLKTKNPQLRLLPPCWIRMVNGEYPVITSNRIAKRGCALLLTGKTFTKRLLKGFEAEKLFPVVHSFET